MDTRLTALETRFDTILPTLATKADFAELKSEFSDLKTEMHANITAVTRWMLATVIALFFGFAGLFYAVTGNGRGVPSVQSAPPIIINVPGTATPPSSTHP
jgi:hypothetical protein